MMKVNNGFEVMVNGNMMFDDVIIEELFECDDNDNVDGWNEYLKDKNWKGMNEGIVLMFEDDDILVNWLEEMLNVSKEEVVRFIEWKLNR